MPNDIADLNTLGSSCHLEAIDQDNITVVSFLKQITPETMPNMKRGLDAIVSRYQRFRIVLEFASVDYLSPAFMETLANLQAQATGADGKVVYCHLSGQPLTVFQRHPQYQSFDIQKDVKTAFTRFS